MLLYLTVLYNFIYAQVKVFYTALKYTIYTKSMQLEVLHDSRTAVEAPQAILILLSAGAYWTCMLRYGPLLSSAPTTYHL